MANVKHSLGVAAPDQSTKKTRNHKADKTSAVLLGILCGFYVSCNRLFLVPTVVDPKEQILIAFSNFVKTYFSQQFVLLLISELLFLGSLGFPCILNQRPIGPFRARCVFVERS